MTEAGLARVMQRVMRGRARAIHNRLQGHDEHGFAGCFYRENDPGSVAARALQWVADASRTARPQQFRLWPWSGK